jgi:CO dehydrogenase maturation factor
MKIAFAGKGGSGKTTLSSLFVRYLAARGLPVVAVDADIYQHLAEALGAEEPRPLAAHLPQIKEYLRGTNPRISSAAAMVKTTPPGRGSRLLRPGGADPLASTSSGWATPPDSTSRSPWSATRSPRRRTWPSCARGPGRSR